MGTHFYMAPETPQGKSTTKSDVFALGAITYAMCTKKITAERGARYFFREIRDIGDEVVFDDVLHELEDIGYTTRLSELCASMLRESPDCRPDAVHVLRTCLDYFRSATNGEEASLFPQPQ
jgi:serine/threonine protein kinase